MIIEHADHKKRISANSDPGEIEEFYAVGFSKTANWYQSVFGLSEQLAEQMAGDAMAKVYEASLSEESIGPGLVKTIARNHVLSAFSTKSNLAFNAHDNVDSDQLDIYLERLFVTNENPESVYKQMEKEAVIGSILDDLPLNFRQAIILHFDLHLPYKALAKIMNKSLPAVKVLCHRAKVKFIEKYRNHEQISNPQDIDF